MTRSEVGLYKYGPAGNRASQPPLVGLHHLRRVSMLFGVPLLRQRGARNASFLYIPPHSPRPIAISQRALTLTLFSSLSFFLRVPPTQPGAKVCVCHGKEEKGTFGPKLKSLRTVRTAASTMRDRETSGETRETHYSARRMHRRVVVAVASLGW